MKEEQLMIYDGPFGWNWVKLSEVAERKGLSSKEAWDKFFFWWGDENAGDLQIIIVENEICFAHVDGICIGASRISIEKNIDKGDILIPAEWAFDIFNPQRLAERIGLYKVEPPEFAYNREYCLAEAILPNETVNLPFGNNKCYASTNGHRLAKEPFIPLIKALGRGLEDKCLVGEVIDVKIKRAGLPNIIVPFKVPADDPEWWEKWKVFCELNVGRMW